MVAGSQYLVAPVLEMGARNRSVYFPGGPAVRWQHLWSKTEHQGGDETVWRHHLPLYHMIVSLIVALSQDTLQRA
eukprot:COSAG02_NODE_15709_length_1147_cov_0.985687_1_plen_75_part_00